MYFKINKLIILLFSVSITILKVIVRIPVEVKVFVMEFAFVLTRKRTKAVSSRADKVL